MNSLTTAYLAIALSVALHVGWNLMARHARRECDPLWWALAGHTALFGPWALHGLITQAAWSMELATMLTISASANTVYFIALRRAYRHASVALVYPLVRSSPLLIALWAWLLFGVETGPLGWLGLAVGSAGLLWLAWSGRAGDARHTQLCRIDGLFEHGLPALLAGPVNHAPSIRGPLDASLRAASAHPARRLALHR